ncbi:protein Fe65 homolog isoform X2 [Frankliniella occidentalis]|nr:protein Fe65 homolog isoform X2 [Frankliniella occidentalis]XP_052122590.1 protein Fe65 homolog isoform X2 [Frankliniella occidentalis]XP_052122591.1 protein Fe65 homolog isoform X2 [Frankliniella occidentalis]
MLCGEILRSPQQCLSLPLLPGGPGGVNSPYLALLAMATLTAMDADNDDIFLENGLLSYENPNYHLLHEDQLNSNTEEDLLYYEHLYAELSQRAQQGVTPGQDDAAARRNYKNLDIGSMGVDVSAGPVLEDTADVDNRGSEGVGLDNSPNGNQRGDMGRRARPDLIQTAEQPHRTSLLNVNSAALDGSDIPHIPGQLNNDLYAVAVKRRPPPAAQPPLPPPGQEGSPLTPSPDSPTGHTPKENLPPGWERHEDNDGPYYWHIKSGTIQREPPGLDTPTPGGKSRDSALLSKDTDTTLSAVVSCVTRSNTSSALEELSGQRDRDRDRREELALKRRSYPASATPGANPAGGAARGPGMGSMGMGNSLDAGDAKERPIRFAVRSLGWVEIAEADLTPERSSKAVNKCIVDLSLGRNDLLDVVGRWGDGKDLFMDLDEGALKLIDPENLTLLNTQPIHTIRVWGVGRDHGRDFAYVARDRTTRKHMCHVFRCDIPARTIANTLRDICKKIMIERSLQQNLAKPIDIGHGISGRAGLAARPTNLPTEHRRFHHRSGMALVTQSFPTPMEEPRKVLRALYLGSVQVDRATGMDVLNDAIDLLSGAAPQDQWRPVHVAVAPSMISILNPSDDTLITECRVRYLSFLGIGRNVKQCAFVMHTAQDLFIAHAFHCEPSSGALCKTVEAACKLRYQKCLDAHPQGFRQPSTSAQSPGRGIGATLKSLVGTLTGRKTKGSES